MLKRLSQQVAHLGGDAVENRRVRPPLPRQLTVREDDKPVRLLLHVGEQRQHAALNAVAPRAGLNVRRNRALQPGHLQPHNLLVQAFLAAEMLVHHRLGHPGARRDLLHGNAVEAPLGECLPPHSDQLISALGCCHSPSSHAT